MKHFDISLAKRFFMPFKGHTMQFRAEAFNAFNTVNLFNPSLSFKSPATFGEFQSDIQPGVIQLALRYEFGRLWRSKAGRQFLECDVAAADTLSDGLGARPCIQLGHKRTYVELDCVLGDA